MIKPLISIITPCYNSQIYLDDMISSVISQTCDNWELIIVDDCSADNSIGVIEKYVKKDSRIKLIRLTNRMGAAVARNKAISLALGRYITFLDSDDYWGKNFLKYSLQKVKNYPFIYSSYNRVNESGRYIDTINTVKIVTLERILKGTPISCLSAFIDTENYGKRFFPTNSFREDLAYWVLLLKDFNFAYGYDFCEANYRLHKSSSSRNKFKMAYLTWRDYRKNYNLNFFKSLYYFIHYAFRGYSKLLKLLFLKFIFSFKKKNSFK